MKMKTLVAVAVAGAFAVPFAAQASADNDRMILAQAGGSAGGAPGSSGAPGSASGGAAAQGGSAGTPGATGAAGASQGNAGGAQGNQAGGPGAGVPPTDLTQLDKNNDGHVSREEMGTDPRAGNFDQMDKDRDGRLSAQEWAAGSAATGGTTK
jgi:hypothetical protein